MSYMGSFYGTSAFEERRMYVNGYKRDLESIREDTHPGDFFEYGYWETGDNHNNGWNTVILKCVEKYSHHAVFETSLGRRESFTYDDIFRYMTKIKNGALLS